MAHTIWLTGLPCSGKTTIAKNLQKKLGKKFTLLDADDDIRNTINNDLGFSKEDRQENLRRVAHICQLLNKKGINVVASFVSPLNKNREMIRQIISNMILVYVKCSIKECEKRDVKGMYAKARQGIIKPFTGIHKDAPFETPTNPDIMVDSENNSIGECVNQILINLDKY